MPPSATLEERTNCLRAGLHGEKSWTISGQPEDLHFFTSIALHALGRQRCGKMPLSKLEELNMGLFDKVVDNDGELDAYVDAVSSAGRSRSAGS